MINLQFYPDVGSNGHFKLESTSYAKCAELIKFGESNIANGLALGIDDCNDGEIPFLHYQQCGKLAFFQIFINDVSSLGEEGWHCLSKDEHLLDGESLFLAPGEKAKCMSDYFEARFCPNVFFSRKLLTSTNEVVNYLECCDKSDHVSCFPNFSWTYLGLV